MKHIKHTTYRTASSQVRLVSRGHDFLMLVKFRLTMLVVLSALVAYLIVAQDDFSALALVILGVGGFSITAAANALNQALEKDYDRLMSRTANRPVAADRMSMNEAVMIGGLLFALGIILLAYFNPLTAVLGATAVICYAFVYTPLKRMSPFSVLVGAIAGALPTMIAVVAVEGSITPMAIALFGLQFFWQFPHFWSIGYLGYEDYKKAGFRLVPEQDGKIHPNLGRQSMIYALLLLPVSMAPAFLGAIALLPCIIVAMLSVGYAVFGWNMQRHTTPRSARMLMFASFLYLPVALLIYYIGNVL